LYIVDSAGHVFELTPTGTKEYEYATTADLSTLVMPFRVTEKLSGSAADYSGFVWGMKNGDVVLT